MRFTFRAKLVSIVAVAALAMVVLALASTTIEDRVRTQVLDIQRKYLPKIRTRPVLEAAFDRVARTLEDAYAASEADLLAVADTRHEELLEGIAQATDAMTAGQIAALRLAVDDWYTTASVTSRQLIAGEVGEDVFEKTKAMQDAAARTRKLIHEVTDYDDAALGKAFVAASDALDDGANVRLIVSGACLVALLGLSIWIGRSLFKNLGELVEGFRRFGDGNFGLAIPVRAGDELGDVASKANQMAERLQRLDHDRRRADWLKTGNTQLVEQLRGELEPEEVADRAATFLARYLEVPACAVYYAGKDNTLRLIGGHAMLSGLPARFERGEGLVGQAAMTPEMTLIKTHREAGLRVGSSLIDTPPRALVFLPLVHDEEITGVIELAVLGAWPDQSGDLLRTVRDTISIALEVARARAATRSLLAETRRQADELEDARSRLEQKADELARASAYKSQFLANMSHELRTPLNAILGFSELMYDGVVPAGSPESKEFLGDILTSGRHLLQLVNDVLDLSKVEAGKLEFHPEPVKLGQVVTEVLAILRTTASTRRVAVDSAVDPAIDDLTLDPARLKQILYNYISNALKFTPEGGRVTIRCTPVGSLQLKIEVEDTGIGIAPDDLQKLFSEFQQIYSGHKRAGGTGLGLALTKRLVEAQGGSVGVSSVVGKGSTFHAILPRVYGDADAIMRTRSVRAIQAHHRATTTSPPVGGNGARRPTVLVVEDDSRDRDELVGVLTDLGYAVEVAGTGAAALALARGRERAFDAITLDLLLPDMTGLEVLHELRDSPHAGTPVIVITVIAEPGAVAGFAVHDLLPKPLDRDRLLASLTRIGVATGSSGSVLVVDDDPTARKMMVSALRQFGYTTRSENDGESGLRAARSEVPAAIVLDLIMPGMNGFEFLAQLRRDPIGRSVPVIVWTSKDLTLDEIAALKLSATAVVTKGPRGSSNVVAELTACLPTKEVAGGG